MVIFNMVLSEVEYKNACTELCTEITHAQLEMLKQHFQQKINSKRTLSRINTAGALFKILEKRDILCREYKNTLDEIRRMVNPNTIQTARNINNPIENRLGPEQENRVLPSVPKELVQKVNKLIRTEIGYNWKEFARALWIQEGQIDDLENKYRGCINDMVQEILGYAEEQYLHNTDMWLTKLKHALEEARRKDLSRKIDKIVLFNCI